MGTDKARLVVSGRPLLVLQLDRLRAAGATDAENDDAGTQLCKILGLEVDGHFLYLQACHLPDTSTPTPATTRLSRYFVL
jgi:hypothetical protein